MRSSGVPQRRDRLADLDRNRRQADSAQIRDYQQGYRRGAAIHAADQGMEDRRTGRAQAPIAVPSRGSSLLAKTVSTTLDRETLEQVVVDGFSPEPALTTCRARAVRQAAGIRSARSVVLAQTSLAGA